MLGAAAVVEHSDLDRLSSACIDKLLTAREKSTYDRSSILVDLISGALHASVVAISIGCERESHCSRRRDLNCLAAVHGHTHLNIG
jgi:hypothetical protein